MTLPEWGNDDGQVAAEEVHDEEEEGNAGGPHLDHYDHDHHQHDHHDDRHHHLNISSKGAFIVIMMSIIITISMLNRKRAV